MINLDLALTELRRSRDMHENNAPIHYLAGDHEQAILCNKVSYECDTAITMIESVLYRCFNLNNTDSH